MSECEWTAHRRENEEGNPYDKEHMLPVCVMCVCVSCNKLHFYEWKHYNFLRKLPENESSYLILQENV